jgi:hypothetical protein
MTTDRPYQPSIPLDEALEELRRCAGTQFDPQVVDIFCQEAESILRDVDPGDLQDEIESPADELAELVLRVPEDEDEPEPLGDPLSDPLVDPLADDAGERRANRPD